MAKRHLEEFNPWPAFVDIFSSVILVLLLFVLVLIVNLGYYMQFKYKVSYIGSVTVSDVLNNSNTTSQTTITKNTASSEVETKAEKLVQELSGDGVNSKKDIDSPGVTLQKKEDNDSKQTVLDKDKYIVITFADTEKFVDDKSNMAIKTFIENAKRNYPGQEIHISAIDSTQNLSVTAAKQVTLARLVGTKSLIVTQGYDKNEVKIKFDNANVDMTGLNTENGLMIIKVEKK